MMNTKRVEYISRANCPDRIFLSSNDATDNYNTNGFSYFTNTFSPGIVGAKKVLLLRATIPNALVSLPDYSLVFWYYKMAVSGGFNQSRTQANLKCVRILPSTFANGYGQLPNMPINKIYSDPSALASDLNLASANDSATFNPYWAGANDVAFAWNSTTKRMTMTGADASYIYEPAGYYSPNLTGTTTITYPAYTYGNSGDTSTLPQPQIQGVDLNMRCGYSIAKDWTTGGQQFTQIGGVAIVFDSFPNLVYTQAYFVYSSIVAGSGYGSNGTRNLMAVIPNSGATLAITNYSALTITWLKKVSEEIYNIRTEIRDDNNMPVILPDNAIVNLEVALKYDEE